MEFNSPSPETFRFVASVAQHYARLIESAHADRETGLGGRLFYAGELDDEGRTLTVSANIAGSATLTATADRAAQKMAIRDGVTDFLVNSLDEALRIIKNQLRKRETVAVCVGLDPGAVENEMQERGVAPDLERHGVRIVFGDEALGIQNYNQSEFDLRKTSALLTWSVASAPAQWLPKLDAIALECLDPDAWAARRWLRVAPRYLGRLAQGLHLLDCSREVAASFVERVQHAVESGEIAVGVEIRMDFSDHADTHRFAPGGSCGVD